jgi:hypothetical protein
VAVLGLLVVLVVLAVALGMKARRRAEAAVQPTPEWHRVRLARVGGVLVGIVAAVATWRVDSFGRGTVLAPAVFGLCVVVGVGLGETVVRPRRAAGTRSASLTPRRLGAYVSRTPVVLAATVVAMTTVLLTFTTLTASRDDSTHTMRELSCDSPSVGASYGPYPGSYYAAPLAVLLLVVLGVAGLAARQVVVRPRGLGSDDAGDDALRRRSLDVVVDAIGIAVSTPYVGLALTAGGALMGLGDSRPSCAPAWMQPVGTVVSLSALVAVAVLVVCLTRLLGGAPQLARPAEVVHS